MIRQSNIGKFLGRALAVAAVALASVLIYNTLQFSSHQVTVAAVAPVALDEAAVLQRLAKVIQFETVSYSDPAQFNEQPFIALRQYLSRQFPLLHTRAELLTIGDHSLLYRIAGTSPDKKPVLWMAHMDVVPVEDSTLDQWRQPPFSGTVVGGELYGRGTIDDKASMVAILEAVEWSLAASFKPQADIYLFFGHDEELGGQRGAVQAAQHLMDAGVHFDYVLDEGMGIAEGLGSMAQATAVIGIAEKGTVTLELTASAPGGHSSQPTSQSAVASLARALVAIQDNPLPPRLAGASALMFDSLAREMGWIKRLLVANRWLTEPLLAYALSSSEGVRPMLQTTTSMTMLTAGVKDNVLPTTATAVINFRLLPGDTIGSVTTHLQQVIDDPTISIQARQAIVAEASPQSDINSASYLRMQTTIKQVFPDTLVIPGLVMGGTDSRHFTGLSDNIYRFVPYRIGRHNVASIHGINERIAVSDYLGLIAFYIQLLRSA